MIFPTSYFHTCKVLDLTSIFVEDVKAFCLAGALSLIGQSFVRDKATHGGAAVPHAEIDASNRASNALSFKRVRGICGTFIS